MTAADMQWYFGWKQQETALQYIDDFKANLKKVAQLVLDNASKEAWEGKSDNMHNASASDGQKTMNIAISFKPNFMDL